MEKPWKYKYLWRQLVINRFGTFQQKVLNIMHYFPDSSASLVLNLLILMLADPCIVFYNFYGFLQQRNSSSPQKGKGQMTRNIGSLSMRLSHKKWRGCQVILYVMWIFPWGPLLFNLMYFYQQCDIMVSFFQHILYIISVAGNSTFLLLWKFRNKYFYFLFINEKNE